jgi:UDP-N-acetylglucosamine 2-epimerase (non-hydrolysing)
MERPEAQDSGTIILTGFDINVVLDSVEIAIEECKTRTEDSIPNDYRITNTSWRVLNLIVGTTRLSNRWDGINSSLTH